MASADTGTPSIAEQLRRLSSTDLNYATLFVDTLLQEAVRVRASDLHLQPSVDGLEILWRLDGMLHRLGQFPKGTTSDIVTRLKVVADLLTYRTDVPQEGRIRQPAACGEMRVSTFPTLFGERAVVRIFAAADGLLYPEDLGLAEESSREWQQLLMQTSGVLMISGPAGSGKTTTAYASLRGLLRMNQGSRSILTIEDPVEIPLPGIAQAQISSAFDLSLALRSALRQDPEVLLVGEIRDPEVARGVFNAALTGHLVLTTLHAGSAASAICRVVDMGIDSYLLHSGLRAVLNQRLARKLCGCARETTAKHDLLGLPLSRAKVAVGCDDCQQTGYAGRVLIAELLTMDAAAHRPSALRIPEKGTDAATLEQSAIDAGMTSLWQRGVTLVANGVTSPLELYRVLRADPSVDV